MNLVIKEGLSLQEAVAEAREKSSQLKDEGIDQSALDTAAARGFGNALFEYDEDEMDQVVEGFYPATAGEDSLDNSSVVSKLTKDLSSTRTAAG